MTYDELIQVAGRAEGQILRTVRGKEFRVSVFGDCPFFIPLSTGQGRSDGRKAAERFLERYNSTGSPQSKDYVDVTRNASYFLALVKLPTV